MNFIILVLSKFRTKSLATNGLIIKERTTFISEQKSSNFLLFSSRQTQNDASKGKNEPHNSIDTNPHDGQTIRQTLYSGNAFLAEIMYSAQWACVCAPVHRQMDERLSEPENSKV